MLSGMTSTMAAAEMIGYSSHYTSKIASTTVSNTNNASGNKSSNKNDQESTGQNTTGIPTVILVHGLGCDSSDWAPVISLLEKQSINCLAVDLRGHGQSATLPGPYDMDTMAKDIADVVEEEKLENLVLVGHSMGTRIILSLRDLIPQKVTRMLFVDGSCQASGDPELAKQAIHTLLQDPEAYRLFFSHLYAEMFLEDHDPVIRQEIVDRALAMPQAVLTELFAEIQAWDAASMTQSLQRLNAATHTRFYVLQSTLVDGSRRRRPIQPQDNYPYLDLLSKTVRRARIEILGNTGHFIQLESPESIVNKLL